MFRLGELGGEFASCVSKDPTEAQHSSPDVEVQRGRQQGGAVGRWRGAVRVGQRC